MNTSDVTRLLFPWLANYLVHSTLLLGACILILRFFSPRSVQLRERIWRFAAWGGVISASLSLAPGFRPLVAFAPSEPVTVVEADAAIDTEAATPLPLANLSFGALAPKEQDAPGPLVSAPGDDALPEEPAIQKSPPPLASPTVTSPRTETRIPSARGNERSRPAFRKSPPRSVLPVATSRPLAANDFRFPAFELEARDTELLGWVPVASETAPLGFAPERSTSHRSGDEGGHQGDDANLALFGSLEVANGLSTAIERLRGLSSSNVVQALLLLGTIAFLFTLSVARKRMTGDLRDRTQVTSGPLFEELQALTSKAGCKRRIRLSIAPHLAAPVSFGLWRSEIALPPRAEFDLAPAQLRAVLAHELAHCLRRDPTHFTLLVLLERLFFFQPLNRVARREILSLAELLCDDQAVRLTGKSLPLASSLAEVARWIIEGPEPAQTAAAMVSKRSPLTERVERLLDDREHLAPAGRHRWFAPLTFALVPAAALGLPGVVVAGGPESPDPAGIREVLDAPAADVPTIEALPAQAEASTEDAASETEAKPAQPEAPSASGPPIGLRLSYELFETELDSTENELSLLEDDLEEAGLLEEFAEPLERMQERLTNLARKAEAVDRILPHLAPPNGGDE